MEYRTITELLKKLQTLNRTVQCASEEWIENTDSLKSLQDSTVLSTIHAAAENELRIFSEYSLFLE